LNGWKGKSIRITLLRKHAAGEGTYGKARCTVITSGSIYGIKGRAEVNKKTFGNRKAWWLGTVTFSGGDRSGKLVTEPTGLKERRTLNPNQYPINADGGITPTLDTQIVYGTENLHWVQD